MKNDDYSLSFLNLCVARKTLNKIICRRDKNNLNEEPIIEFIENIEENKDE